MPLCGTVNEIFYQADPISPVAAPQHGQFRCLPNDGRNIKLSKSNGGYNLMTEKNLMKTKFEVDLLDSQKEEKVKTLDSNKANEHKILLEGEQKMSKSLLTPEQQEALFNKLDEIFSISDCDKTLKHTRKILEEDLSIKGDLLGKVIEEINDGGGYCDCEVLMNYFGSEEADVDETEKMSEYLEFLAPLVRRYLKDIQSFLNNSQSEAENLKCGFWSRLRDVGQVSDSFLHLSKSFCRFKEKLEMNQKKITSMLKQLECFIDEESSLHDFLKQYLPATKN